MASESLAVHINVSGVRQTLRAFSKLPKEANDQLRDASLDISKDLAGDVAAAGAARGGQAALMARTVKAVRDRVPAITAGGSTRVGRHAMPAHMLLFASEFGMNRRSGWYAAAQYRRSDGRQYPPHLGRHSYWFFSTVDDHSADATRRWEHAADAVVRAFGRGV
jgi:hypothetical protein